jgi:hypothetical protein
MENEEMQGERKKNHCAQKKQKIKLIKNVD